MQGTVLIKIDYTPMIRIENLTIRPEFREVFVDNVRVDLGSRAMDLLLILAEANGAIVPKEELINRVWPSTVVADNNLHVHISAIRKMLGRHRNLLLSVPGRGYRLLRPDRSQQTSEGADSCRPGFQHRSSRSFPRSRPFERDASHVNVVDIAEAAESLSTLVISLEEGQLREVVISRAGQPVARLTPVESVRIGVAKSIFPAPDTDDNSSNEAAKLFLGGS